ncbi:glutamate--cysteine ligase [Shigella flexneri]
MIDTRYSVNRQSICRATRYSLPEEPLEILREEDFVAEREASERRQQEMEAADTVQPFARVAKKHALTEKKKATREWPKFHL